MFCINVSDITVIYSLVADIWHRGCISNFCFMALLTYVNYNHDYDVNQVQRTPILYQHYRKCTNQTGPYSPQEVSLQPWHLVWWIDINVNCSHTIVPVDDGVWQSAVSTVPLWLCKGNCTISYADRNHAYIVKFIVKM